jgi:hypothetical protein
MSTRSAYFFKGARYLRYNIDSDAVDVGPTQVSQSWPALPPEFQSNLDATINWSWVDHWERRTLDVRLLYVMERLVDLYGYSVNGAAGLAGNLAAESEVIPTRIEGSAPDKPLRSRNFQNQLTDFTPDDVMNRNAATQVGPKLPGIGLAQWTSDSRRAGLFKHPFKGDPLGARVVFNMDAQLDYLATELRTLYLGVQAVLVDPLVSVSDACDEVVYDFEVPGSILQKGKKLPRTDPAVQKVFAKRRLCAQRALNAYRAVHPQCHLV